MAINGLISDCRRALESLESAAQEARDAAAADRDARMGLLDGGDIRTAAAGQADVLAMVEEVRQAIEEDKQRSDADQQELERAALEWYAALDALQQLLGDG